MYNAVENFLLYSVAKVGLKHCDSISEKKISLSKTKTVNNMLVELGLAGF